MRNSRATNYHSHNLSELQKSLLKKEPSLAPTPSDINWYEVRRDFDKFVNQLSDSFHRDNIKSRKC